MLLQSSLLPLKKPPQPNQLPRRPLQPWRLLPRKLPLPKNPQLKRSLQKVPLLSLHLRSTSLLLHNRPLRRPRSRQRALLWLQPGRPLLKPLKRLLLTQSLKLPRRRRRRPQRPQRPAEQTQSPSQQQQLVWPSPLPRMRSDKQQLMKHIANQS